VLKPEAQVNLQGRPQLKRPRGVSTATSSVQTWSKANIRYVHNILSRDEYIFETRKGKERSTDRDDWRYAQYKGKDAWWYFQKDIYYYTREKPGGK
jgi:hypothetical protein